MRKYPALLSFLGSSFIAIALSSITLAHAEEQPLTGSAYQLADEAYKAFAQGKYDVAVTKARQAIQLRPDVARLQELLKKSEMARRTQIDKATTNAAHAAADEAYKAYDKHDYAAAARAAQHAIDIAPGKSAYWLLRMNALIADGKLEEAKRVGDEIERKFGQQKDLLAAQKTIKMQLAFAASTASYNALERGDSVHAIEFARKAVDYLPEVTAFQIGLINILVADGKLAEAEQVASDTISSGPRLGAPSGETLLLRGAIRQIRGATPSAQADFDHAISIANPVTQRDIRLVAVDAALVNGDLKRASYLLEPIKNDSTPEATARQALLAAMSDQPDLGQTTLAFSYPVVGCTTESDLTSVCSIKPGSIPADLGFVLANQGYRALSAKNYSLASTKAAKAIQLSPQNRDYRRLYVQALIAQKALAQAEEAANDALANFADDTTMLLTRADIRKQRGNIAGAKADYEAVLMTPDAKPHDQFVALVGLGRKEEARKLLAEMMRVPDHESELDLAYLALQAEDNSNALEYFGRADAQGTLTNAARLDAGYTAARVGQNDHAIKYLNQTVDAAQDGNLALDAQQVYEIRRSSADLSRSWGVNALLSQGSIAVAGIGIPHGSSTGGTYAGAEAYWRPFKYQNGTLLEIYSRLSETVSGGKSVQTGSSTAQVALGARVKPFSESNTLFALERLKPLGDATSSDWLARVGYSSDAGLDLHVDKNNWFSGHLYAEAGHFFQHPENYAALEGQLGHSYRLGAADSTWIVFPHLVLGGSYDSTLVNNNKQAWGSGLGTNIRYWFRQDHYNAPRSYADLSVQYRWRVAGDDRAEGWFIRFSTSY